MVIQISKMDPKIIYRNTKFVSKLAIYSTSDISDLSITEELSYNLIPDKEISKIENDQSHTVLVDKTKVPAFAYLKSESHLTFRYEVEPKLKLTDNQIIIDKGIPDIKEKDTEIGNRMYRLFEESVMSTIANMDEIDPFATIKTILRYFDVDAKEYREKIISTVYEFAMPLIMIIDDLSIENQDYRLLAFQNVGNVDAFNVDIDIDIQIIGRQKAGRISILTHDVHGNAYPREVFFGDKLRQINEIKTKKHYDEINKGPIIPIIIGK